MTTVPVVPVKPAVPAPSLAPADDDLRDSLQPLDARGALGQAGSVHSWELVTAVDGPGTRLTYFLAGCPLRCLYCHNPDTWQMRRGTRAGVEDIMKRVKRYKPVLDAAEGGVTLSGGVPLLQAPFVENIFAECRQLGIHTALDTSGFLGARASDRLLDNTDLVMLDVKSGDPEIYKKVTGRQLEPTLKFGRRLAERGIRIWIRYVLVPDLTDDYDSIEKVADYAASLGSLERVEVLPFHQMGREKWEALNEPYALEDTKPPTPELVDRVKSQFAARGLLVY